MKRKPSGKLFAVPPRVHVTRRVPERVRAALEESFDADVRDREQPPTRDELLAASAGCAGLVTMLTERVDDELLDAAGPQLRVVANFAVGVDNVDLEAAARRGVVVSNTPGVLTEATAELTVALLLALVRRVAEGDRLVRGGEPWVWAPTFLLGRGLRGCTLGIVGPGRIGSAVARLARAFRMDVLESGRTPGPGRVPLGELLARADAVSVHVPLTPETRHLLGREELRAMRPDAVLVNTSRGPVVDEVALVDALRRGEIGGAALDVYEREPEVEEGLLDLENVVLAPHLGSATLETREAMGLLCVDALRAVLLEGRIPANAVGVQRA
ncbi:MAG TPA: D-glycerate dehydrogenase [Gaiellaceae bacterium]|nr:D-glycerate dehydrogenase [Gaiellaceae bacterium]